MSKPTTLLKLTVLTFASIFGVILLDFVGLIVTAGAVRSPYSAGTPLRLLFGVQMFLAFISIVYVYYLSGGYFGGARRMFWVVPFAILQIALCAFAMLLSIVFLNG